MPAISLLDSIRKIEQLKCDIAICFNCGTIIDADTAFQIEMLNKQQLKLKQQLINEVHITKDGTQRKIEYKESKGLWMTMMSDKSKVYGKTKEIVIDKLMEKYGLSLRDYSFKTVFEEAIAHKDRTEAVNPETLYHLQATFNRFIDSNLADTDIRNITCDSLSEYTLNMLRTAQKVDKQGATHKVKKKAYLGFKSVLNVVFEYALLKDMITINPLTKFNNKAFLKECDCSKAVSAQKIFSDDELNTIKKAVRSYMKCKRYNGYFVNGYAILLSIETGMRAGELSSLKWSDIHDNYIHIHSQQLANRREGGKEYYYADWTKDEKGISKGGRKFPLTKAIKELLSELKKLQESKGIHSDFVFCHENGEWIKTDAYITCLRRMLTSLGFNITNNHAFRMSLNSNILAGKLNLPTAKRAELLGHSVETNMAYYTYATKDDMDDLINLFDSEIQVSPRSHQKVITFEQRKSPESSKFKAFL